MSEVSRVQEPDQWPCTKPAVREHDGQTGPLPEVEHCTHDECRPTGPTDVLDDPSPAKARHALTDRDIPEGRKIRRQSIEPTYDSRETGPRYYVTSTVNDRPVAWMQKIDDPFVRHTVHVHWTDLLRALIRGRLKVEVLVGGDRDIVDDVLELDGNTLIGDSSRRAEFDAGISKALVRHVKGEEAAAHEAGDLDV